MTIQSIPIKIVCHEERMYLVSINLSWKAHVTNQNDEKLTVVMRWRNEKKTFSDKRATKSSDVIWSRKKNVRKKRVFVEQTIFVSFSSRERKILQVPKGAVVWCFCCFVLSLWATSNSDSSQVWSLWIVDSSEVEKKTLNRIFPFLLNFREFSPLSSSSVSLSENSSSDWAIIYDLLNWMSLENDCERQR